MKQTALHSMHVEAGARMVPFAGYDMPVQYAGVKAEHLHTRAKAGLFDVSHMGQLIVSGASAASELERIVPLDLESLPIGRQCYTFFPLDNGGILDDLIIARIASDAFYLVINASRKNEDIAHLQAQLKQASIQQLNDYSLLALQGPHAEAALTSIFPSLTSAVGELGFMSCCDVVVSIDDAYVNLRLCRSGYTGEDGFELSVPSEQAEALAALLLAHESVEWIGLGARDSLRLEAGLCLYGQDLDESISPVEAALSWSIHKARRSGGSKVGGFIGAEVILQQLEQGVQKRRVAYFVDGKAPVRQGSELINVNDEVCGKVSSGGFSPSLSRPVLMAYVDTSTLENGGPLFALVRGKKIPVIQTKLPFVARSQ